MSRQFATNVTTIYDIFCPVPFLPSPFGFRRLVTRIAATSNHKSLATAIATQRNHCDSESACKTAISLGFLQEKLATSKL